MAIVPPSECDCPVVQTRYVYIPVESDESLKQRVAQLEHQLKVTQNELYQARRNKNR